MVAGNQDCLAPHSMWDKSMRQIFLTTMGKSYTHVETIGTHEHFL